MQEDGGSTSVMGTNYPPEGGFESSAAVAVTDERKSLGLESVEKIGHLIDDPTEDVKNSLNDVSIGSRKLFRRRRRTNSFKRSNSSATWHERREEARRRKANARRRQSLGLSVAPYNTTQFLMEEHKGEVDEEELLHPRRKRGDSFNSVDSYGEDYMSSSYEDEEYLHAQFCAVYDSVTAERLHSMSKTELVHEYLLLEARIERLQEELKQLEKAEKGDIPVEVQATEEDIAKIAVFQEEIERVTAENCLLQVENQRIITSTGDTSNSLH